MSSVSMTVTQYNLSHYNPKVKVTYKEQYLLEGLLPSQLNYRNHLN